METVHTILREDYQPRLVGRWRQPAPLLVLVLADGRWVRTAFYTTFSDFKELGSEVHSLGADFVQKLFDHTVLVPSLSSTQVDDLTRAISGRPVKGKYTDASEISQRLDEMKPSDVYGDEELNEAIKALGAPLRASLGARRAAKAATIEAAEAREHILTRYAQLLPSNPRLIKRVANAWAMLMALGDHVGHQEDQDVVIRAAILMVRFPGLVDALLTDVDLPDGGSGQVSQSDGDGGQSAVERLWQRSDVQAVAGDHTPMQFARCFGRNPGAPPPAEPERSATAGMREAARSVE